MGFLKDYLADKAEKNTTEVTTVVQDYDICGHNETVEEYEIVVVGGIEEEVTVVVDEQQVEEQIIVIQEDLPFPLCPGEFWAEGLKTVYGARNLVLGYTNSLEVKMTETSTAEVGPMHNGLVIEIGKGECETVGTEQFFRVNLNVVDFKMTNDSGSIHLNHDGTRESGKCVLVAKNTHRVLAKFDKFSKQVNWAGLAAEHNANKVEFYKRYLEMFYPSSLHIYWNTEITINWDLFGISGFSGKQILLNRKPIELYTDDILTWPPASFHFSPKDYIELIEMTSETSARIVNRIERFQTIFIFPFISDASDVEIMEERLKVGLSFEYILQVVTKYVVKETPGIIAKLPFSTEPATFWKEAITTIYGGEHQSDSFLLMGVTNSMKLRFGDDSADAGVMLSGLTVKIDEVFEKNSAGKPEFSLNLKIVDFKMTSKTGGIDIELDNTRDVGKCVITATQTDRIAERFQRFTKRVTWSSLVAEFEQNRIRFYKKYLALFYPATISLSFNIKKTIHSSTLDFPGFDTEKIFINRETLIFNTTTISRFPPTNLNFMPTKPIEFVHREAPTVIVITVGRFDTTFVTPQNVEPTDIILFEQHITNTTITFEIIREKVTKYVVTKLPFPSEPAKFWAEAIRVLYGDEFVLLGQSDSFTFTKTEGDVSNTAKMHNGIVVELGDGTVTEVNGKKVISIGLILKSFKMVDAEGGIEIEDDSSRKREEGSLVLGHGDKVIEWFNKFSKNLDLMTLIEEFNRSPVAFYRKHIHRFYPAVIQIGLNIKKAVDGAKFGHYEGSLTVINRETIWLTSLEVLNFPPSQVEFTSLKPIEFVAKDQPTVIIITVNTFGSRVIYLDEQGQDPKEVCIIREIIDYGLTFEIVREKVIQFVIEDTHKNPDILELPFPVEPTKFWIEAIKTIYGPDHALLGISEYFKFKGPDGHSVDFGKMLNGLTYRITEINTTTNNDIQITFEIVDFKFVSTDGKTKIYNDSKKPGQKITITVKNTTKVLEVFESFKKTVNWTVLVEEYERNTVDFYKQHLDLFFPADISISFNLKNEHQDKVYVTPEIVVITYEINEFPPKDLQICPTKPIKLVGEQDSTIVVYIEEFDSKVTYPEQKGGYNIAVVDDIFEFDLTYEIVEKYVTEYVISQELPFSTCPGQFWKDALITIHGTDSHLLMGIINNFNVTTSDGKPVDLGTMLSAISFKIKEGHSSNKGDQFIQVILELLDYKLTSKRPGLKVHLDKQRPAEICTLTVKNPADIFIQFNKVFNHKNWNTLITEYQRGPKQFYTKYIELFNPSSLTFSYNTTFKFDKTIVTVTGTEDKILVNQHVIVITYDKLNQFPPNDLKVITRDPIILVERDNPDKIIVTVSRLETTLKYQVYTEKADINAWQNVIDHGITIEYIWTYTKQWVGETGPITDVIVIELDPKKPVEPMGVPDEEPEIFGVPFPLCAGEFWSAAVRHIYGHKVLMLGSTDNFTIGGRHLGSLHTGVILEVGQGACEDEGDDLRLNFKVTDVKLVHENNGIQVVQDTSRKNPVCSIVSLNSEKIAVKFNQFHDSTKWKALTAEYFLSPVKFYKKHIEAFYPAVLNFGLNLKYVIDGSLLPVGFTEKKTLINKETIWFTSDNILRFPPSQITFIPKGPVILVEKENPTVHVTIIETFKTHLVHWSPDNLTDQTQIKNVLIGGLTFEIVRIFVVEKLEIEWPIPKLPFSLYPAKLWTEAIKTVYGENFVFFGLTDSYKHKGPKGEITLGPFHNGFSLKFLEVKEDLEKGFHITFDVVDYKSVSENDDIEITYDTKLGGSQITVYVEDETKIIETIVKFKKTRNWEALIEEHNQNKMTFYEKYIEFFYPAKFNLTLNNLKYTIKGNTSIQLGFKETVILVNKKPIEYVTIIKEFPPTDLKFKPTGPRELVYPGKTEVIITITNTPDTTWILPFKQDKYDIDFVKQIFLKGLTYEIIHHRVVTYIVSKRLPFSINPGTFFIDGIKTLYGPGTLLLGACQQFHITLNDGRDVNVGPLYNGFTLEFGQGYYEPGEDIVVNLKLTDYKMTNKIQGFQVQLDTTREGQSFTMTVENTTKIIERFTALTHEKGWDALVQEYNADVKLFYKKYIYMFFPYTIKANVNLKYTIDGKLSNLTGFTGKKVLYNKEIIEIVCKDLTDFPPLNLDLSPVKPIQLVGASSETIVITIKEFKTTWTRPIITGDDDYIILRKLIKNGLTFEYIITTVPLYILIECPPDHHLVVSADLPFPICPGDFWATAIKTIYGETTLLLGNTEQIEFTDEIGKPINDGSLLSSILLKVHKGTCESLGVHDAIKVKFDILDFKLTTRGSKLEIEIDNERKGGKCTMEAKNVAHINGEFNQFANPENWVKLTVEYKKDPVKFYQKYISMFFPATIRLSFNLKHVRDTLTLVNREIIHVISDEILSYPPSSFEFHLKEVVEFVEHTHRTVVVIRITKLETSLIHLVPEGDEDIIVVKEIIKSGKLTYEFVIKYVLKYLIHEVPKPKIPELPFSLDPIEFWQAGFKVLVGGETDLYLSLSKNDFILSFTDGTITNFGPILSGMTFKLISATQVGTEFVLKYDIVDLKMVSNDGSLEIEIDREVTVGQITITTKNGVQIVERLEKFKNTANWESIILEYNQSPKKFYEKHIEYFYPAEMKMSVHFKYVINGTRTLVTKDVITFVGDVDHFKHTGVVLVLKTPLILVENRKSTDVIAKVVILEKKWIFPVTKDNNELIHVREVITKGTLTYVIVREYVYRYILQERIPFPVCPGEFFAQAIKTLYSDGHLFLGITHHYKLTVGGKDVDVGPMLSALTLKVHEGVSWEYTHDKSIRIRIDTKDFKTVRRDGGIDIEIDSNRERGDAYIVVNNTDEIFKKFAEFFYEDKWELHANFFRQNPKKFYEKHITLFFPASIHITGNFKYSIDGSQVTLPGIEGVQEFVTKEVAHYHFGNSLNFPLEDMRFKNEKPMELIRVTNPSQVVITIKEVESVFIRPEEDDKAKLAIIEQTIISGLTYKIVYDMVSRYIVVKLPFPTDIGAFWQTAIKTLSGEKHLLLGVSAKTNVSHPDKVAFEVGPILCGLLTSIGHGHVQVSGETTTISVDLNLMDFKLTNYDGAIEMQYDATKPVDVGKLTSLDSAKVIEQFAWFANPAHWEELIALYEDSPRKFYQKYVKAFYPARIEYNMNVTAAIGSKKSKVINYKGSETVETKTAFHLVRESVPNFPPSSTQFIPHTSVELFDTKTQTLNAYLLRKRILFCHPSKEEKSEQEICLRAFESGLTFDFIRNMVPVYMDVPTYQRQVRVFVDWVEI